MVKGSEGLLMDPTAELFFTASGITGARQLEWVNRFYFNLKGGINSSTPYKSNLFSKILAWYGYIPIDDTTASLNSCKFNLINPVDSDEAFRMDWVNNPTAAITGMTGGSGKYGITHWDALSKIGTNNFGLFTGLRSQNTNGESPAGAIKSTSPFDGCQIYPYIVNQDVSFVGTVRIKAPALTDRTGLLGAQSIGSIQYKVQNGVVYDSNLQSIGTPRADIVYALARNLGGSPNSYSTVEQNSLILTLPLTENELIDMHYCWYELNLNIIPGGRL